MQQERTSQGSSPPWQVATLELISSNAVVATATAVAGNQVPRWAKDARKVFITLRGKANLTPLGMKVWKKR